MANLEGLLGAAAKADAGLIHKGFRRLVTFQSRYIVERIMGSGTAETLTPWRGSVPYGVRRFDRYKSYIRMSDGNIETFTDAEQDKDKIYKIAKDDKKEQIWPFYAYEEHRYCGDLYKMSLRTIYRMASHLFGYMGYEDRDIIELSVPEEYILESRSNDNYEECLLPYIKKEWVVSILRFDNYVTEPVHGENALKYVNEVYRTDTYRMCYGNDIVFNGHGYGDNVEYCMSPRLLGRVSDVSIQRDYVQSDIWNLFKKYLYIIRHGLNMSDIVKVKLKDATAEMPDKLNLATISSFEACINKLCQYTGVEPLDNSASYNKRVSGIASEGHESSDDE